VVGASRKPLRGVTGVAPEVVAALRRTASSEGSKEAAAEQ